MSWGKRRAIIIVLVVLFVVIIGWAISSPPRVPSRSTLVLDIGGEIQEQRPISFMTAFNPQAVPVTNDYVEAIDRAKDDPRVAALAVRISPLETGWGKLEEIREHLLEFRRSGKPNVCYLETDIPGNPEYYLASACDQIWLVPTGTLAVRGMMAQATFLRGTLDKLKIVPDYYHIAEYKTASNELTEKKFTPAHREEVESLLRSIYNQYLTEVAAARGIARSKFESLVQQGPFLSSEAATNRLVDRQAYWDQVQGYMREKTGQWNPVSLARYREQFRSSDGPRIAVIHATGLIVSGESETTPGGSFIMGGDSVAADIRRAREDAGVKAIVLRIDSGGGSAVASEVIRREVQLARSQKTIVVSMSDVAASGGYWIAMSANKIVAEPNTITASIGVIFGKLNISGLYQLLGLSTDSVSTSENASLFSFQQNFTPSQREAVQKLMNDIYANFTHGVAENRKMKIEEVNKIAKGRVWSGLQAKSLGLIDELGGLERAVAVAKQLSGIPASRTVRLEWYPREKTLFEWILERNRGEEARVSSLQDIVRKIAGADEPVQARMPFELIIR